MKSVFSYVSSFILSIFLIFSIILSLGVTVAKIFANPDKLYEISVKNNMDSIVYNQLDKYFSEKQNTTGIPSEIYMNAIDSEYINSVIRCKINNAFYILVNQTQEDKIINDSLNKSISDFYSDYAESINHPKDAVYDEKLAITKENAYKIISDYCDIYKFSAIADHGILKKVQPFYNLLPTALLISWGAVAFLMLLIILVNIKATRFSLYWSGVSAIISGIMGAIPCFYLKATDYFSAFTIKQPQVYTSYTSTMNAAVDLMLKESLVAVGTGIVLLIIYAILVKNKKYIKND